MIFVILRTECASDASDYDELKAQPFKYGFCHEGSGGACCAPAHGFYITKTFGQWKWERGKTTSLRLYPHLYSEIIR